MINIFIVKWWGGMPLRNQLTAFKTSIDAQLFTAVRGGPVRSRSGAEKWRCSDPRGKPSRPGSPGAGRRGGHGINTLIDQGLAKRQGGARGADSWPQVGRAQWPEVGHRRFRVRQGACGGGALMNGAPPLTCNVYDLRGGGGI